VDKTRKPEICVVHLVRAKNGIEPFRQFLESYANNRGGIEHDLLIIFKGFYRKRGSTEYNKLLKDSTHKTLFVSDIGYDIRPYFIVAKTFDYKYFCFLNSYSVILDKDWLLKMYRYISYDNVGVVGATGSYQSGYSMLLNSPVKKKGEYPLFLRKCIRKYRLIVFKRYFDPFPNYHIRTNAFMISKDLMCKIQCKSIHRKFDVYRFESSKKSLTKQIINMKYRVLVVGKDGKCYEKEDWYKSDTFWIGNQSNLLIADNQTRAYLAADPERKRELSQYAWGDKQNL